MSKVQLSGAMPVAVERPTAEATAEEAIPGKGAVRRRVIAAALGLVALLFVLLSPWPFDRKLQLVGYACCAQAPARTLSIGGHLMPVDARDAGIYLGFLLVVVMAAIVGRGRAGQWPGRNATYLLVGMFAAMVLDGVNSSMQSHGAHGFYHTSNALRLVLGTGAGLALAVLCLPLVNRVLWRVPEDEAVANDPTELAGYVVAAVVLGAVLLKPNPILYYPLSLLSALGVLVAWGLVNTAVVAVAMRRERRAVTRVDGALLVLAGIVLTLCEVWAVDAIRLATAAH